MLTSMLSSRRTPILYVENDVDDAFLLETAFKRSGAAVDFKVVDNGERAVAYLSGKDEFADREKFPLPRVVLLDWNMPLMSGAQFLEWLRSQPAFRHLPVVVFTSSESPADLRAAYDRGANGFMTKPSTQRDLQALAGAFAKYWLDWNRSQPLPAAGN
jgi:CheY-like chemotaxis protein